MCLVPFCQNIDHTCFFTSSREPTEGPIGKGMSIETFLYFSSFFSLQDYVIIKPVTSYISISFLEFHKYRPDL